ncbi:MAG: hypothetical protein JJU11_10505, partial [Candidatus Sumerlaeia bacterium]|nr:hypothetical protein [Candidatus Sumerlaeia bacterium]
MFGRIFRGNTNMSSLKFYLGSVKRCLTQMVLCALLILAGGNATAQTFLAVFSTDSDGPGTLRAAIDVANDPPVVFSPPIYIVFEIPGPGPHTIHNPGSMDPLVLTANNVIIDSTIVQTTGTNFETKSEYDGSPLIRITGPRSGTAKLTRA